jgi:hypothetical protein
LIVIDHGIFNLEIDGNLACMNFNPTGDRYPTELINSSFEREVRYLLQLKKYSWAPEAVNVDRQFRRVYFKWHNNTCEEKLSTNWKEQLEQIARDLHTEKIYKPSFYTKYFYIDNEDQMHAYAFYSASDYVEQPISMEFYQPILNTQRKSLVEELQVDGKLDMGLLVKHAFTDYIKWPDDPLPELYHKIYLQS